MSTLKSTSSPQTNAKPSTPQTRGFKTTKKRSHPFCDEDATGEESGGVAKMDFADTSNRADVYSPVGMLGSETSSPIHETVGYASNAPAQLAFNPRTPPLSPSDRSSTAVSRPRAPPSAVRPPVLPPPARTSVEGLAAVRVRQPCLNLQTCIRLTPTIPPGRMEFVQTGVKVELVISNMQRAVSRGLEEYVNERAIGCFARDDYSVERIKLYVENGDVVLFGKVGTEYDVRALHFVFRDIAAGSQLRYCPNTFPDLESAIENAKPWLNQGESRVYSV